jgi:hypothetical protein
MMQQVTALRTNTSEDGLLEAVMFFVRLFFFRSSTVQRQETDLAMTIDSGAAAELVRVVLSDNTSMVCVLTC